MNLPSKIVLFLFLSITSQSFSQESKQRQIFTEISHPVFASAKAAYLKKNRTVDYSFRRDEGPRVVYAHEIVIKIYDREAIDLANFQLHRRIDKYDEYVFDIEGEVINSDNGEIVKTKLSKENIFKKEENQYFESISIVMPSVKEGSVVKLKYKKRTSNIFTIARHYFQFGIPVDESIIKINLPSRLIYTPLPTGTFEYSTTKKEKALLENPITTFTHTAKDVPPLVGDEYIINIDDYRTSIKYELHTFFYRNGRKDVFSKSWNTISKELLSDENLGKQIRKKLKPLENIIAEAKVMTENDRARFLYEYVRDNYQWNGKIGIFADNGVKKLIDTKSGNSADINLLLINLLQKSGINATPLVQKVRWKGELDERYPTITELDYLIAYAVINDENILIDATDKLVPFGQMPLRAVNDKGIVIEKKGASLVKSNNVNRANIKRIFELDYNTESGFVGMGKYRFSDFAATYIRKKIFDESSLSNELQSIIANSNIDTTSAEISNLRAIDKPIIWKEIFSLRDKTLELDDKIFIDAMMGNLFESNPFTAQSREFPFVFNYQFDIHETYILNVPKGYKTDTLPKDRTFVLPGNGGVFIYEIKDFGDRITVSYSYKITKNRFSPSEYPSLRNFTEQIFELHKEKIIFVKK